MKVKLFKSESQLFGYDNYIDVLSKGIIEWEECTEEEYNQLSLYSGYVVVRQVEKEEFKLTLQHVLKEIEKRNKASELAAVKYKEQEQAREQKKKEKAIAKAKKLLEQNGISS